MLDLITAQQISKRYHKTIAVDNLSLSVAPGEIYGLVGPDGAGKTTTIRMICGAIRATTGEISISNYSITRQVEKARSLIGYLSQRFSLYEDLTTLENIRFFAEIRGVPQAEWQPRCMQILEFVGLAEFHHRKAGQLSGGMKQKLGLASALVMKPRVLLLDEPTTGVDPITRQDFWQLIIQLAATEHIAVLISTPYMDEASRCHRVGFMRHGHLIAEGSPQQLKSRLDGQIIETIGHPLKEIQQAATKTCGVIAVQRFGDRLHLQVKPGTAQKVIAALSAINFSGQVHINDMRSVSPSLEDVFIALSNENYGNNY